MDYIKIARDPNSTSPYHLNLEIGDQKTPITQKTTDGFFRLPENPICRYIMADLVDFHLQNADSFILNSDTKSARKYGVKNSVEKKKYAPGQYSALKSKFKLTIENFDSFLITDEERDSWNDLCGVVKERYEAKLAESEKNRKEEQKLEKAKSELQKSLELLKAAGIDISTLLK